MTIYEEMSLDTLDGGALNESFQHGMQLIVKDINDPNKPATAERSITFTIKVKPDEARNMGRLFWSPKIKLADPEGRGVTVAMDVRDGEARIAEYAPQRSLFSEIAERENLPENVKPIDQKKERS